MSELLLKQAAIIRDETSPSANTAERVGLCLESVIREHDSFAARFPVSRIPALVIDISHMDAMNTAAYARVDKEGIGAYYIVTRLTKTGIPMNVGTLEVFSDDSHHVITQVFKTHELLSPAGTFNSGHDHNHIYIYTRSYGLTMGGQTTGPATFPLNGWGRWRPMTALPIIPGEDEKGMAGLMSVEDKMKLDAMEPLQLTFRKNPADVWPAMYYFSADTPQQDFADFFAAHPMITFVQKSMAGAPIYMKSSRNETVFVRLRSHRPLVGAMTAVFEFDNIVLTLSVSTARSVTTYTAKRVDLNKTFITL